MFEHTKPIVDKAEAAAAAGASLPEVLKILRRLGLDDFGLLLINMPDKDYPALSAVLPKMASEDTQNKWAGTHGVTLLRQSAAFARQAAYTYQRATGKKLDNGKILDFGCGFGRIIRMMYYFTDPDNIYGIDPWDRSLEICRNDRVAAQLRQSERVPAKLPVDDQKFDLVYALSVFTHLSQKAAFASFAAIRAAMKPDGILLATIRPVEFWEYFDRMKKSSVAPTLAKEHEAAGFAYQPHAGALGETYGDTSMSLPFVEALPGWELDSYDRSLIDTYQLTLCLRPKRTAATVQPRSKAA